MSSQRGFTLIELMVAVSVLAILVTVGIPSMIDFIQTNRRAAAVNALVTDLQRARSTAAGNVDVVLCHSADGAACSGAVDPDWSAGWILFIDDNRDGTPLNAGDNNGIFDAGETLLSIGAPRSGVTMPSNTPAYRFNPGFQMLELGGERTVAVCIDGPANDRWILVGKTGRPHLITNSTEAAFTC